MASLESFTEEARQGLPDGAGRRKRAQDRPDDVAVRTALSGQASTPGGATEIAYLLGKDESLRRIDKGIELLRG